VLLSLRKKIGEPRHVRGKIINLQNQNTFLISERASTF
jgi:hypothetical protein